MNNWSNEGILLAKQNIAESIVITVLTKNLGIQKGFLANKKTSIKPPALIKVNNKTSRSGYNYFSCEYLHFNMFSILANETKNLVFQCLIQTILSSIYIAEEVNDLYPICINFIELLSKGENWYSYFIFLELTILEIAGFRLDLSKCAISKSNSNLKYISPKTGRAISQDVGSEYHSKLLLIPPVLPIIYYTDNHYIISVKEFIDCFSITNFFLEKHIFYPKKYNCFFRNFFIKKFRQCKKESS
ncbi:MAG: DNA repair protein RecO [Candidatus Xenolissoclinum pacificiensis L6]|uniref:DNA repair protein RecO n=1 Tax=Candidatus Xenolissoclinum pacificiensis L6 TaxID=1401685 RepID=W2V176_9RICK|nr:MAG: DNA repair protein RecO [Candidatus Xenolissoclinum pacificiensis L6]